MNKEMKTDNVVISIKFKDLNLEGTPSEFKELFTKISRLVKITDNISNG